MGPLRLVLDAGAPALSSLLPSFRPPLPPGPPPPPSPSNSRFVFCCCGFIFPWSQSSPNLLSGAIEISPQPPPPPKKNVNKKPRERKKRKRKKARWTEKKNPLPLVEIQGRQSFRRFFPVRFVSSSSCLSLSLPNVSPRERGRPGQVCGQGRAGQAERWARG